jgi:hypothetical protein
MTDRITKYIEDERKKQGLNSSNVTINSEVFSKNDDHILILKIIKNGKEFIHLSIHLVPTTISPDKDGIIHIYKNIYRTRGVPYSGKKRLYALVSVKQPINKPNSLEFSINNTYYKTNAPNSNIYDPEINKEIDVILIILNRLFDEKNEELYIRNKSKLKVINSKINDILNNINSKSPIVTRKNKGIKTLLKFNNNSSLEFNINSNIYHRQTMKRQNIKKKQTRKRFDFN